ncbi:MAG: SRPBCC family protein [Candidatus Limnocylindrales bacterium]
MSTYTFVIDIAADRDAVFALWTNLERAPEWIEGLAGYEDVSGPADQAGTTYTVRFGSWSKSRTNVLESEPPRYLRVKFGNWFLRGEQSATFETSSTGTRLTQTFKTVGIIPAITARIFASGSYKGSFRGELETFKNICEREAASPVT